MAAQLCICTSKIRSANQLSEDRSSVYGGHSLLSILASTSCGQPAPGMHVQLQTMGLTMSSRQVIATMLRIEIDQNQPLFTDQDFLQNPQGFKKLQSSKIVTSVRFCQCNSCLSGEMDSWCLYSKNFPEFFLNMVLWFLFA